MHCPYCKSHDTWRLQPYPWMNRIHPRMRNRRCSVCGHEFALWFHRLCFRHKTAQRIVFLYQFLFWLLLVLLAVDLASLYYNPDASYLRRAFFYIRSFF